MTISSTAILSRAQLATLRERGEERSAAVGDVLFQVGDETYPLIAILEGEAAVQDPSGREIIRHGAGGFLGELNLLSGQTVFLTAVATQPMRYLAVEREVLRELLFEDGPLGDLLLSAFMARREALQTEGIGPEIIGPGSAPSTRRLVDYLRRSRVPHVLRDSDHDEVHLLARGEREADVQRARHLAVRRIAQFRAPGKSHERQVAVAGVP